MSEVSKMLTYFGSRIQNYGYLLANPAYSKLRNGGGCGNLYRLLNNDWFPRQEIRTVLDVGANEGQFIKTALALMPDAAIYGFEPNPESVKKLEKTDWGSNKVNILPIACGSKKATLQLNVSKFSPSSSLLKMEQRHLDEFPGTETEKTITVEVERLDHTVASLRAVQSPFLLKIDVQGFEGEVLAGATGIFNETRVIVCEINMASLYENQCTFDSLIAFLSQHHYRLVDMGNPIRSRQTQEILFLDLAFKRDR
jgi:FkbM family methyltransferase